ncbi:MAG: TIGR03790 family protein [Verrucomicrobia bacterium]|nr:TIGR03790 family protein [Verrucomicrobiota bacterium]
MLFPLLIAAWMPAKDKPPAPSAANDWNPAAETVVVYNKSFNGSKALADFYAEKRHIPADKVVGIECSNEETISRNEFENTIHEALLRKFNEKKWWTIEKRDLIDPNGRPVGQGPQVVSQNIRVVVLMRGVPLRIKRNSDNPDLVATEADEASVDSEIASLGLLGRPLAGPMENRYFQSMRRFADHYEARGQLIVGRLDAADDATVKRMIEDSLKAEHDGLWGRAAIDFALKDGAYLEGEQWLGNCVKLCRDTGIPVFAERSRELLRDEWPLPDTILYFGWYADNIQGALASPDFRFKPGAIASHLHSYNAALLRTKTEHWCGPMLDHGAAAVLGNVWEPYLKLTTHFDLVTARLLDGFTLGEAMWSGTPALSWMNVLVGDPLYTPFPKGRQNIAKQKQDEDYAVYRDIAQRLLLQDAKKFRRELIQSATDKNSPRLLEFAGLFSTLESAFGEAEDFFTHAGSLHASAADQLRCALYAAELAQRRGKVEDGRDLFKNISTDPRFSKLPGRNAALALEKEAQLKK